MSEENTQPEFDTERGARTWHKRDIYTGPSGQGTVVPNLDDLVYEIVGGVIVWSYVSDVNTGNYLATLVPSGPVATHNLSADDVALGVGPGAFPHNYVMYVDKSTVPYTACLDARAPIYGTDVATCKVFVGTDLTAAGRVVSAMYNSGGTYLGEDVPMELVATDTYNNNVGIKTVAPFKTSAPLADGEVVTAVFYNTGGQVVGKQQFKVENTRFVRRASQAARTVVGLKLQTPFLSLLNAKTIVFPQNLTLVQENLIGVVVYNDGQEVPMPVDGERFIVEGLDAYDAQATGISFPLVLKYVLDTNENAYGGVGGVEFVTEEYTLVTAAPNLNYDVRLIPFPKWVDATAGYRLTWYLFDASRSVGLEVTTLVNLADGSAAFQPTLYGHKQTIRAIINMAQVEGNYNSFNHLQEVDVSLLAPGTYRQNLATPPNWLVTPVAGNTPMFGVGVFATFVTGAGSLKTFRLKGNFNSLNDWLQAYYYNALPIVNAPAESEAPEPTHFVLVVNGAEFPYAIDAWNDDLTVSVTATNNQTVYVRFQYEGQEDMLELSAAGMPLYQVNTNGSYI